MAEILDILDKDGKLLQTRERSSYYKSIKQEYALKGSIETQIKQVRLLLMNTDGRIYLQKRSAAKGENPGLWDKSIEGHVPSGSAFDTAIIRECAEELGFAAVVLRDEEFWRAVDQMHLEIIGVLRPVDTRLFWKSRRTTETGETFELPLTVATYIGYYNGHVRFVDGESSGLVVFSCEELLKELSEHKALYTNDLSIMIQEYCGLLRPYEVVSAG